MKKKKKVVTVYNVITSVEITHDATMPTSELDLIAYQSTFCGDGCAAGPYGFYRKKEIGKRVEVAK